MLRVRPETGEIDQIPIAFADHLVCDVDSVAGGILGGRPAFATPCPGCALHWSAWFSACDSALDA